jgi:glycosyltransferase A (GT-A) superfamily protein (DUF2064 family)
MPQVSPRAVLLFTRAAAREHKPLGLGRREETRVHRALLGHAVRVAAALDPSIPLVIAHDGLDARDAASLRALAGPRDVVLTPQRGTSFDARVRGAVDDALALGFERLVLIGADTPSLATEDLERALGDGLVAGPSVDGGFYLLGFDRSARGVLDLLPWRTRGVWAALEARARGLGLTLTRVARRRDLDDATDLAHLAGLVEALVRAAALAPLYLTRLDGRAAEHRRKLGERLHTAHRLRGPPSLAG